MKMILYCEDNRNIRDYTNDVLKKAFSGHQVVSEQALMRL